MSSAGDDTRNDHLRYRRKRRRLRFILAIRALQVTLLRGSSQWVKLFRGEYVQIVHLICVPFSVAMDRHRLVRSSARESRVSDKPVIVTVKNRHSLSFRGIHRPFSWRRQMTILVESRRDWFPGFPRDKSSTSSMCRITAIRPRWILANSATSLSPFVTFLEAPQRPRSFAYANDNRWMIVILLQLIVNIVLLTAINGRLISRIYVMQCIKNIDLHSIMTDDAHDYVKCELNMIDIILCTSLLTIKVTVSVVDVALHWMSRVSVTSYPDICSMIRC